jgi:dipeptidase E
MKLLLFSNSTNAGEEYLSYTISYINEFLKGVDKNALFIPFAVVSIGFDTYFNRVSEVLLPIGINLSSVHHQPDMKKAVLEAKIFIVGGGNTFALLKSLQKNLLLELIRKKVRNRASYIAWNAGANIACPTIRTTNDMPITEPENFNALHLIPF